jgi:hypothetical protein
MTSGMAVKEGREWFQFRANSRTAVFWICGDIGLMHRRDHAPRAPDFSRTLASLPGDRLKRSW